MEVSGIYPVGQEIVLLIGACVLWSTVFYGFYQCKVFCQVRYREVRQKKLLSAHRCQSEKEQTAVDKHWPWPEAQSQGHAVLDLPYAVPRQRRNAKRKIVNDGKAATQVSNCGRAEEIPCLVPIMMSTPSCIAKSCKQKLMESASELRASREDIRCFEADSGWFVQTQLKPCAGTANTLKGIAAKQYCSSLTMQLGRWRACCLIDGEVKTMKLDESVSAETSNDKKKVNESLSSDESNRVPVILYSSYEAGLLTVEGLNLANATIQIASKRGGCTDLETKCSQGEGDLEVRTCMSDLLDEQSVAEVSVIAFKEIIKDGYDVRISSLPVQIRDDSLKTVLRDILPYAILVFYAAKHILWSVVHATPTVAWLIPLMIIASTQVMPQRTEPTIKSLLKKMIVHVCLSFYSTFQTFMCEIEAYISSMDVEDEDDANFLSIKDRPTKRPRSRKQTGHVDPKEEHLSDDEPSEQKPSLLLAEEVGPEAFVATHGSGSVLSSNWQWPVYDTIYENDRSFLKLRVESKDEKTEITTMVPFVVVYLNLKNLPWASQVQVNISSPFLKRLLPGEMDRWKCKKIVTIDGPELFRSYEILKAQQVSCAAELESSGPSSINAEARAEASMKKEELQHISHLVRFMDKEFEEIKPMYEAMKNEAKNLENCVTWEMLWAFFPPREKVVYLDEVTDEHLCGEVLWTDYQQTQQGVILIIKVTKWDYNCKSWSEYTSTVTVPAFAGDRPFSSLDIRPIRFDKDPEATEKSFLEHGKRFCELSMMESNCYMNYRGSIVSMIRVDNCHRVVKENADGRVMIDLGSFSKMNPDYPLGSAKPPCEVIRDNVVKTIDITMEDNRMFAPSFVYGFSFRLKKWGCFSVCGFSDIEFNDSAYDDLVMSPATKTLTESLVREHLKEGRNRVPQDNDRVDPIANKGEGCILLCYGPPGTGKTLTAESLSEKLHCPLWCLSVFELGITPAALETMLVKVLDVVASWGAILLLDEADVYLERRSSKDLVRNAMTGVFLRQLEYYRGVLFLTTNRDSAFDEAICSRIAMFLYYGRHDKHQRSAIWNNLFRRVGLKDITDEDLAEFSKPDLNGREIRKIVKTAQTLAKSEKSKDPKVNLEAKHVRQALTVYEESSRLRTSLNPPNQDSFPVHLHPNDAPLKVQGECPVSTFGPILSELHPSSSETNLDDECPQLTPTSSSKSSETNSVDECPQLTPTSSSHSGKPSLVGECLDPSGITEEHTSE